MSTSHLLSLHNTNSTARLHAFFATLLWKTCLSLSDWRSRRITLRPRTSERHGKTYTVGVCGSLQTNFLPSKLCRPCIAMVAMRPHVSACINSSVRFHRPGVNAPTGFCSLHSLHSFSSRYFARKNAQSMCSPPQNRSSSSRPFFAPF